MITTVTTTTTTTLTMVSAASLTSLVILTLIIFLIKKELLGSFESERAQRLSRMLNIAIVPLSMVFIAAVALKVVDSLR